MDIQLGLDGQYAICYQSDMTPDLYEEKRKFQKYRLFVRVDSAKGWVFLRSTNLDDIKECIAELGDTYNFTPCRNSRKRDLDNGTQDTENVQDTRNRQNFRDQLGINNRQSFGNKPDASVRQNFNHRQDPEEFTEVTKVYEVVVLNLPPTFMLQKIKDLCRTVGVVPVAAYKHLTKVGNTPYCSVYVRSPDNVALLCNQLNGASYDNNYIMVKDANDLL